MNQIPFVASPGTRSGDMLCRALGRTQLLAKTKEVAVAGKYELFKSSSQFDSTAKLPDWLGGDTPGVEELAPPSA
jgi:hypothetical protein